MCAGLLGFPPKDLQYRFLSTFKPAFYIRQRDYSKARQHAQHVRAALPCWGMLGRAWNVPSNAAPGFKRNLKTPQTKPILNQLQTCE
jgi:hypothetical protein